MTHMKGPQRSPIAAGGARRGASAAAGLALLSTLPARLAGMAVARVFDGIADRGRRNALEALAEQGHLSQSNDLELWRLATRVPAEPPQADVVEA